MERHSDAETLQTKADIRVRQDFDRRIAVITRDEFDHFKDLAAEIRARDAPSQAFNRAQMFRYIWYAKRAQTTEMIQPGQKQIATIDKEIDKWVDLIMASGNEAAIDLYEQKIAEQEHSKARLAENLAHQAEPRGSFEEKLEPALQFLASSWKIWESGNIALRRIVLKLAFADRIRYSRIEGARTDKYRYRSKC